VAHVRAEEGGCRLRGLTAPTSGCNGGRLEAAAQQIGCPRRTRLDVAQQVPRTPGPGASLCQPDGQVPGCCDGHDLTGMMPRCRIRLLGGQEHRLRRRPSQACGRRLRRRRYRSPRRRDLQLCATRLVDHPAQRTSRTVRTAPTRPCSASAACRTCSASVDGIVVAEVESGAIGDRAENEHRRWTSHKQPPRSTTTPPPS
jgi:hypothetical protein